MIELRQFRQFIAVAEELHFRRAAERLQMSQPPLTQAIQRLEEALGVRLLDRNQRGVRMTEAGAIFLEEARRAVAQAEHAIDAARRAGQGHLGSLRIVFVSNAMPAYLPPVLRTFHQQHPEVALELLERTSSQQVKEIRAERADIGFLIPPLPDITGLKLETVFRENLVAVLPRRHPLVGRESVQLADLAHEPFVMFPVLQGPGLYAHIMLACARAGFTPQIVQEAHHLRTLIGLVAAEIGVTLVPASLRDPQQADVAYREVYATGVQPQYDLAMAWREANASPVVKAFLTMARAGALQT